MAGSATITEKLSHVTQKITWAWTSDGAGAVNGNLTVSKTIEGPLLALMTIPSGGGTAPTDLYDLVINDVNGHDILAGTGTDRSATLTQYVTSGLLACAGTSLDLRISNAGASKQGTVVIWI